MPTLFDSEVIAGSITSDDILGKEVIDNEGEFIGVVEKLHLTPSVEVVGITIDRGFLKREMTVGKGYIERVTPYALFLNIRPAFLLKGMLVYDSDGGRVGRVTDIALEGKSNNIQSLVVNVGKRGSRKKIAIAIGSVSSIAQNILLNKKKSELETSVQKELAAQA